MLLYILNITYHIRDCRRKRIIFFMKELSKELGPFTIRMAGGTGIM
jgi:hypothetical protein